MKKKNKSELEQHMDLMKEWNRRRAANEKKGIDKFRKLSTDPLLHPSKKSR